MSQVDTSPDVAPVNTDPLADEGDHERMTHIVLGGLHTNEGDFVPTGTTVAEGIINQVPVRALCGKVWVPGRDPRRYPLCPTCKEIAQSYGWQVPAG
ncbi:MAG TPA: DUF3039 domain-containing protein [Acidimicrobiales bacterium]|nr:DUF3039 domain-containing protein [Acidimicrobiales bacterium]